MTAPEDDARGCADGAHAPLVARAPVDAGASVTIAYDCPRCGRVVCSDSWTTAAWQAAQNGPSRRPRVTAKEIR